MRRKKSTLIGKPICNPVLVPMKLMFIEGDLLDQDVEVIVNAWNRNIIPWWLLLPQGVSGAIKKSGGYAPFRELAKMGPIPLHGAVETGAGKLPFKAIIHVAGISMWWRASKRSIAESTQNAVRLAAARGYRSIALPLIGAGTGRSKAEAVLEIMREALESVEYGGEVQIVRFKKCRGGASPSRNN
jgi:O-acetyl-ADP-ribose deacetylase (regulator of RNase III)